MFPSFPHTPNAQQQQQQPTTSALPLQQTPASLASAAVVHSMRKTQAEGHVRHNSGKIGRTFVAAQAEAHSTPLPSLPLALHGQTASQAKLSTHTQQQHQPHAQNEVPRAPLNMQSATRVLPMLHSHSAAALHTPSFLSPLSAHTPASKLGVTQPHSSGLHSSHASITPQSSIGGSSANSSLSLSAASSSSGIGSADHSFAVAAASPFTSPIHPHHLSFEADGSPLSAPSSAAQQEALEAERAALLLSPVPLAPFSFTSPTSAAPHSFSAQPPQHTHSAAALQRPFPQLASNPGLQISTRHLLPMTINAPHSAGTGTGSAASHSAHSGRAHHHQRSNSSTEIASIVAASHTRRSRTPMLNSKRLRGSSMDLEAERDAGATLFGPSSSSHALHYPSSSYVSDHFDPNCPASGIIHSMRKLRVKKSDHAASTGPAGMGAGARLFAPDASAAAAAAADAAGAQDMSDEEQEQQSAPSSSAALCLPPAPSLFTIHTPLRKRREAAAAAAAGAPTEDEFAPVSSSVMHTPSSALRISIPGDHSTGPVDRRFPRSDESSAEKDASMDGTNAARPSTLALNHAPLHSPPAAHRVGKTLSWSDDEDDDEQGTPDDASVAPSSAGSVLHSRPMMVRPSNAAGEFTLTSSAQRLAAAQAALPLLTDEDVSGVATCLDFGAAADSDQEHDRDSEGDREDAQLMRAEGSDCVGMALNRPSRRTSSMASFAAIGGSNAAEQQQQQQQQLMMQLQMQQSTPTHSSAPSRTGSGSGTMSSRFSPVPHHTPLTPTATNFPCSPFSAGGSRFGFGMLSPVTHSTPLPLLPSMKLPESRLPEDLAAAAALASATKRPSSLSGVSPGVQGSPLPEGFTELDFRSPVTSSHQLFFPPTEPEMSPLGPLPAAGGHASASHNEWGDDDDDVPVVQMGAVTDADGSAARNNSYGFSIRLDRQDSMDGVATARMANSSSGQMDDEADQSNLTPPSSPPRAPGGSSLMPPSFNLFAALSPDPKAFQESAQLQPKAAHTPMRLGANKTPQRGGGGGGGGLLAPSFGGAGAHPHSHQKQPPPTPMRPTSIKRIRASGRTATAATSSTPAAASALSTATPLKHAAVASHLVAAATADSSLDSPPTISLGLGARLHAGPPPYLPPCHSRTRLERTSSLYDSKVLIDFTAHLAAAAAAKKQREAAAAAGEAVPEEESSSLNSSLGRSSTHATPAASSSSSASASAVSSTPCSPVEQTSIWDSSFTNKELVGRGSFFETFRCQSCYRPPALADGSPDLSDPRAGEYGQFFAVKRSLKPFRGKKDRGLYLREVALMESLGDHENIVRHIRAWQEDMHFFIQMEYCPLNLSEYVSSLHAQTAAAAAAASGGSPSSSPAVLPHLSDSLLKNLTLQLSRALCHIHSRGLVHLDIKPDNILVSFSGIVRLADFGQARMIGVTPGSPLATGQQAAISAAMTMCPEFDMDGIEGDSVYMAPELLNGGIGRKGPSSACDIFSLGLTLVELASGATLPKSGQLWHDLRDGRAAKHIHGRVSAVMEHVILNLLEPQPDKRPTAKSISEWVQTHQTPAEAAGANQIITPA